MSPRRSASALLALAAAAVLATAGACRREGVPPEAEARAGASAKPDAPPSTDADADGSAEAARAGEARPEPGASAGADASDDDAYGRGTPRSARSIGHTSVVLKVELSTGKKAVFKPASRRGPLRYKGEIAAHRLALALGLPNVPRAMFRSLGSEAMATAMATADPPGAELFAKEAIVKGGLVKGALIPWIEGLEFLPLEREPLASELKRWLKDGEPIPEERRALARDVSTLVAFDYLTGNWDRWSGGNVGQDRKSGMLLFIDNDGAFFEAPPADALAKNERLLLGVERFSRSFVARVRELDDAALARAIGEETPGVPLLSPRALAGVARRRARLLEIVDGRASKGDAGGDGVLPFP